jgi:hypothetical protein
MVRYLDWILDLGFASKIILSVKVKVLGGGFSLWLGENIAYENNASIVKNMNHCLELKKRKETHKEMVAEKKEPSKKVKHDEARFRLLSQCNNILQSSCTHHVYIVSVHIMHIYFLEDNMFK